MKTKDIIFMSMMLIMLSVVSCLKTIDDEEEEVEIKMLIPDENEPFHTNTRDIAVPNAVSIAFSDGQTNVNNPFEGQGVTVSVNRQNVTITSTITDIEVNYVLSGNTNDGFVKIYGDYRFGLVLNGVSIKNPTGAAINIQSGKRASVTLVDNTFNRLIDVGIFQKTEGEDMKATFFSEGQLIFDGTGNLLVYGNTEHAIRSDDYIRVNNGNIMVKNAIKDGIHSNDYFEMNGGNINIYAQSDGVECGKGYITINGGIIKINADGDGLKSVDNLAILGGNIEIESLGNGISVVSNIIVTGGEIYCYSGKKGIVSEEGAIVVMGGLVVASAKKNVFDCDQQMFSITGGTAVGVGGATIIPTSGECRQRVVVWGTSKFTVGQLVSIKSADNSEVLTFKVPKAYSGNMALVFTSSALQANTSYTIYKGGNVTGGSDFHGLYSGAVSSGGTAEATFTTSAMVTAVGDVNAQEQ